MSYNDLDELPELPDDLVNPVVETMTRVDVGPYRVRVWRNEPLWSKPDQLEASRGLVRRYVHGEWERSGLAGLPAYAFARRVATLSRVAAVEVLDPNGDGVVYYPDWS